MQKTENSEKMYRRLRNVSNTQLLTVNLIITQPERSEWVLFVYYYVI